MVDWNEVGDRLSSGFNGALEGVNRGLLKLFGNSNEREVRKMLPRVEQVNAFEPAIAKLSDEQLKGQTAKFRARLAEGATLEDLLPEAFATCREAGKRFMQMRHYDVQLIGGMVLHSGRIAEMVTGEGKTLVATLAAYLNALEGQGVHVVTVNDYLARRDAEWMTPLYEGLGLTVGAIQSHMDPNTRKPIYDCDITYGTNNEFGFDYLRDNMKPAKEYQSQGKLRYAIIDEVDSILIDEARTPLIISGPAMDDPNKYRDAHRIAKALTAEEDFEVKEKERTCHLTEVGVLKAEKMAGVESFYTAGNMQWPHLLDNALKAQYLYKRDKDYMVRRTSEAPGGEVVIIDESTGRAMEGRQWSDGLHQAVEAKEGVTIKQETQTLATITFQNFFKLYDKISGMTGTAMTEANEFWKVYKLDVVAIPTNKPLRRANYPDVIYRTEDEKWQAVVDEVKAVHRTGRPVLVGTTTVEISERLSRRFKREGIGHEVLNAKFVEREAEIVAQAGTRGAVTISTNMAGRGTDIVLGGNPEIAAWAKLKNHYPTRLEVPDEVWKETHDPLVPPMKEEGRKLLAGISIERLADEFRLKDRGSFIKAVTESGDNAIYDADKVARKYGIKDVRKLVEFAKSWRTCNPGGLHIVGTERHESRRIDNQLRGRAGRQGDPGSSRFYVSLEDELMRIFAGEWVKNLLGRMGMKDGEAIESKMVSRRIEAAQKKVEERNFEARKNLLEYDEIMDTQRTGVYGFRQNVLEGDECRGRILEMVEGQVRTAAADALDRQYNAKTYAAWAAHQFGMPMDPDDFRGVRDDDAEQIARESALQASEVAIADQINDNLNEDFPPEEWNWEALANWFNATFSANVKAYDLKKVGRDGLDRHLYRDAAAHIGKVKLAQGRELFDPDLGARNLLGWMEQKFGIAAPLADMPGSTEAREPEVVADWLVGLAREQYRRKEIDFPVHVGMSRYMADKTQGHTQMYDREGLVSWANSRFGADLDFEDFKNLPRPQVRQRLVQASEAFFARRLPLTAIDEQLDKSFDPPPGKDDDPQPTASADTLAPLSEWSERTFGRPLVFDKPLMDRREIRRQLQRANDRKYRPEISQLERSLLLQFLDTGWKDHLYSMDHLKSGIGLVGYAQIDPKTEYKRQGKKIFAEMWQNIDRRVTDFIFRVEDIDSGYLSSLWNITGAEHQQAQAPQASASAGDEDLRGEQDAAIRGSQAKGRIEPIRNREAKVGRNDPCPCGSGKKYKHCHMKSRAAG